MPTAELPINYRAFPARQPLATGNSDSLQYDFRFHRYGFRCGYSSSFPSLHTLCKQLLYTGHRYTGWVNTAPAVPDLQKFLLPHSKVSSAVRRRQCHNPVSAVVWVKIAAKSLATGNPLQSNQTLSVSVVSILWIRPQEFAGNALSDSPRLPDCSKAFPRAANVPA